VEPSFDGAGGMVLTFSGNWYQPSRSQAFQAKRGSGEEEWQEPISEWIIVIGLQKHTSDPYNDQNLD
jgi:hypothetical protein